MEQGLIGHSCYAWKQAGMWEAMARDAAEIFRGAMVVGSCSYGLEARTGGLIILYMTFSHAWGKGLEIPAQPSGIFFIGTVNTI